MLYIEGKKTDDVELAIRGMYAEKLPPNHIHPIYTYTSKRGDTTKKRVQMKN